MNLVQIDIIHDYIIQQESSKTVFYVSGNVADYYSNPRDRTVPTEPLHIIFIRIWPGAEVSSSNHFRK